MKKAKWLKLIDAAIGSLEELEAERSEFESDCADKSERWQESEAGERAQEIIEVDLEAMINELSDLRGRVE